MADETNELVCSVLLDQKYDFLVVVSKSRTIGELRAEIDNVAREVYPEFRGGQVSRVENLRGSILPDRYKVGTVLRNESRIICYSSDATGGKEKENAKKRLQQVQIPETVRNKLSVANNKAKHSLLETKRKHTVCSSSEEMLFASKYKSLYSMPEHCRLKRKEAIETSASKVAEWLSTCSHEVSSNVDSQDTQSDEETMEVESGSEDRPKPVVGKRVQVVEKCVETVTSVNRKGNSDDDEDDSDVEDGSCYGVGEDSDNSDDSKVNGLDNSQQATDKKATTCYTPKSARDARVSVSTSKTKRRALSTTLRGTQSNLPPSATDRKDRSTNSSDFPSLAGNLPKCRIKIRKLPLCIKHGRNLKVGNKKRSEHRDFMCNRDSNYGKSEHRQDKESDSTVPQKEVYLSTVKNQRIHDHYADIEGDIESGVELLNDKRRNLVNSLSRRVTRHLGSKNGISNRFPKRANVQRRSYLETSEEESSSEDHDDRDGLLTENRNNSDVLNRGLRQSSQSLIEDATTKNDNDTDGDKDDNDDESDDLTPRNTTQRKARLTVAEVNSGEEGDVISFVASEAAVPELDIQRGAGCKEKGEISWKGKKIPTGGTNSIEESRTQNINKQIEKQASSEKDVGISPKQCRSPKKNLLSKKSLLLSKSKGAVESSKQKTDDTLGNETGDNSGESQLRREINETSRLSTVPMIYKSHSERLVNIELSEGKYSGVDADDASGIVVEESRELVAESNAESTGNTNDHASVDERCQEMEANNVSQADEEAEEKEKESTPMYLTPIKKGEQIAWLKESSRTADSEQMGDEYEDFMKRLEMSDCNTSSNETERSKTENSPPLSSETDKENENNEEKGQGSIESRTNGGRKSTKKKKRSQRKNTGLEGNENTFVTNVGQESVSDKTIMRNKTMEENLELEFNSPINKRSQQKHRKLEEDIDTMAENFNEETVGDIRIISEETIEGNVELELTPQSASEKRSTQKQRKVQMSEDTLVEKVNEETVGDITMISEKTTEGDVELQLTAQIPTEKRSEQKQEKLENEHSLVENVGEDSACDERIISKETTKGNEEVQVTRQSPTETKSTQKRRKLEDEHSLVENVGEEGACDERIISKETTEGNGELEVTPQSPTEKKSKQKQRKLEDEHSLVENVGEESVCDEGIISKETTEGNGELEVTPQSPTEKKSKQKRRKLEDEHSLMETSKKKAREEGSCEDQRNDNIKKTHDGKTGEGANIISDGHKEGNQKEILKNNKKKNREKGKKKNELSATESSQESTPTSSILEKVESSSQSKDKQNEAFNGEEKPRKKDRYREEKHGEDDEKSHERKTSNQMEKANSMSDRVQKEIYEQKSKKKKKEKRRKSELNSTESAAKLPSPLTIKTVTSDSLDDSGCSENGHNKSTQHEQCRPEQVESVQQLRISKKRKARTNPEKETLSGQELPTSKPENDFSQQKANSKKKSKTSLSLLDLALDDTAEQGNSNKAGNRKTVQSEGRRAHQMARHFRQMPKGFLHSAKIRRTASQSTVVVRRKPRTNPKANLEMTAKDKDLVISGMSFEQLLDDESLWTT